MSSTLLRSKRAMGRACAGAAFRGLQGPIFALLGLVFSTSVFAATTNLIQTATPASAPQGTNGLVVAFTLGATPPPPPTNVPIRGVTIGSIAGTPFAHTNQYVIAALFAIPGNAVTGAQDVTINYGGGAVVSYRAGGFTITPATSLTANFTATPTSGMAPLAVSFTDLSAGMVTNWLWDLGDGGTRTDASPTHTYNAAYVRYVRGNPAYGINKFVNNGDGTITDKATWLMWVRDDSGVGMNWSNALAWVQQMNASNHLGHNDWRLPNAKELHSLFDYSRSPDTTASAAIRPLFNCTAITNEAGQPDFPWYWTGTTLMGNPSTGSGVYLCFGRAMAYMNNAWVDAHGAGAQRSDPKGGSLSSYTYVPNGYFSPLAPQGDAIRIYSHVRLVRDVAVTNSWRFAFVGDTHTPWTGIPAEIAASVVNDDAKFLLIAGDLVDSGAAASTNTLASQLAQWRSMMAPLAANGIPVYVIRGNHEDDVNNDLAIWTNFFSGSYAMPANGPAGERGLTYSFAHSNALFVALDNYVNLHRVNQPWLDQQLGQTARPHLFVFGHEPAFKAFHTDCLDDYPPERNAFWNSLANAGAKIYLCGHDHFYNVARIDDGDGNPANDLHQVVVGTGGSTNWPVNRYNYNGTNAPFTPVNVASVTNIYGYLLVEISGPGSNDLSVKLTWKQRTFDAATASYFYVATNTTLTYAAVNCYTDSVGDGISDWWRARYFGGSGTTTNASSCATCDPDGDGAVNAAEYGSGTNPTNAVSVLRLREPKVSSGELELAWDTVPGKTYGIQSTTNLHGAWLDVPGTATNASAAAITLRLPLGTESTGFYRVRVIPP